MNNSTQVIVKTNPHDQNQVDYTLLKQIQSVNFFQLFRFADKTDVVLMIIGTFMAIICGAAEPAFALLWGNMTNSFSSSASNPDQMVNQSRQIMYNFFELGCGVFVASWLMLACWVITGERQAIRCRKIYLTKLLQQQIGWFDRTNQTELASKFATETFSYQGAIGEKIPTFVMSVSMVFSGLTIALIKGWKLSLVVLSYLPVLTIAGVFYVSVLQNREKKIRQHYTAAGGKAQQTISSIKTVKSLNGQKYQQQKFNQNLQLASNKTIKFSIFAGIGMGGITFAMYCGYALSFWYGSHLIGDNPENYNSGTVLTIFFSIIMGGINLSQISPCLKKFAQGQQAAAKIYALIDRKPKIVKKQNGVKLQNLIGVIKFENVSFAYPKDPNNWILKNLNMQLKPNQTNALVGQSGCGKSTIMQLVMRFYDPQQGQITLDGVNLKELDLQWLRQKIGYVGQEPVLFATTIKQNLLFGKYNSTDQQIKAALKKAEAYDFIFNDLPDKLQTYVGYGGGQLSGGQKQRIAIARAILKNPKILLLDEATSALDRKNQKLIQQTLDKITTGRTTITIAHRVKTIMNAEEIFVFNEGKVTQSGKFKQLKRFKDLSLDFEEKVSQVGLEDLQMDAYGQIISDIKSMKKISKKEQNKVEDNNSKYQNIFARLFQYNMPNLPLFIVGVLVALGNGTLYPFFSLFLAKMMEALIKIQLGQNQSVANFQSLIFLVLAIAGFLAISLQTSIFLIIGENITKRLRLDTFKKIIRMPVPWFDIPKNNSGSLAARLGTDCQLVNGLTSTLISTNIQVFSTLITGLLIAFFHEWRITLITIGLLPFMIGSGIMKMKFTMGFSSQTDEAYKDSSNLIMQAMSNIRTVTSFGVQNTINKKYVQKLDQPMKLAMKKGNLSGFLFAVSKLCMYFIFAVIFYIGTLFVKEFNLAFVDVFTAIFAIMFSAMSVGNNSQSMPDVGEAKNSAANIFEILDGEDEDQLQILQNSKLLTPKQCKGQIQIKNITFKYPNRIKSVFENFSMKIEAGHKVAFVGSSGCGKSTIIQMLMRFYEPLAGDIYLDGINIKDYNIHHLRSIFGLVSQEPVLFYTTYKENIKYNTDATFQQIIKATQKANALSFIQGNQDKNQKSQQQKGFNKNVGVKGGHISGGQKQRVAIARTVLRNPKILLLDEATSALDSKNEKLVQDSLDKIMEGLTCISVAHRIQTIKNSNKIYVFDSGKIIEQGNYEALRNKKGYFYRLQKGSPN